MPTSSSDSICISTVTTRRRCTTGRRRIGSIPANWTYKRQAWSLEQADTTGTIDAYGTGWLDSVQQIGAEHYYPEIEP